MPKFNPRKVYDHINKYYFSGRLPLVRISMHKKLYRPDDQFSLPTIHFVPGSRVILGCCNLELKIIKLATHCRNRKQTNLDLALTLAHEMLHIDLERQGLSSNHGNNFRKRCARLEKLLQNDRMIL